MDVGKKIVYCSECGKSLREDDFEDGTAHLLDGLPYCVACRALRPEPPPPTPRRGTPSAERPTRKSHTTAAIPKVKPPTARYAKSAGSGKAVAIGIGLAGAAFLGVLLVASSGGAPGPVQRPPAALPAPEESREDRERQLRREADEARREHEKARAEADRLRKEAHEREADAAARADEARLREAEAKARDAKVNALLEEARALRESDPKFQKKSAVLAVYQAAIELGAPRRGEVERVRADYEKAVRDAEAAARSEEGRLREAEAKAREAKESAERAAREAKEREIKVAGILEDVRKVREGDPKFEQNAEVRAKLQAALEIAGARKGEVERLREDYEKALDTAARHIADARRADARRLAGQKKYVEAAAKIDEYPEALRGTKHWAELEALRKEYERQSGRGPGKRTGPYEIGAKGHVTHWLTLGVFPNPSPNKGFDVDYLGGEEKHVPAPGAEVLRPDGSKAKWEAQVAAAGTLDFFALGEFEKFKKERDVLAYAACWLESEVEQEVELRVTSDDGHRLWVNGKVAGERSTDGKATHRVRLQKGFNPVRVKVGTNGGTFSWSLRVSAPGMDKAPGVRVWN
jgi:hypothetical protein